MDAFFIGITLIVYAIVASSMFAYFFFQDATDPMKGHISWGEIVASAALWPFLVFMFICFVVGINSLRLMNVALARFPVREDLSEG